MKSNMRYNMSTLIDKKKSNISLSKDEIKYIVDGYTKNIIPDYQMSAFLMSICFNGMSRDETYDFTMAMTESGEIMDLSGIKGIVVDKHSTGGVGDKVSLCIGPMVAACGVPVAKMSGRGLGHTGGTIDKLESFDGFNTSPDIKDFIKNVNDIGIAWAGQTANLAPADKKIYGLRDVTATVDSMPLIASSIMSKKLASGADAIVLDVTYGSGAFMKTTEKAEELARIMMDIGKRNNKKMSAVITNMEEPLGHMVGNALEVKEAVDVLYGNGPDDVLEVALALGSHMLYLGEVCKNINQGKKMLLEVIKNGKALDKMAQWIERQGGSKEQVYNPSLLKQAEICREIKWKGEDAIFVAKINGKEIGRAVTELGGGRRKKEDEIDITAGVELVKKVGDEIKEGEVYCRIFGNDMEKIDAAEQIINNAYAMERKKILPMQPVYKELF